MKHCFAKMYSKIKQCYGGESMEYKKHNSLDIEGLGNYPGGEFDRVNISGKGKINGDLICKSLDISGMATIEGNVIGERINTTGLGKIRGNIMSDEIDVSGSLECYQDVTAKELNLAGMFKAKQCLKVDKVHIMGMLTTEGDISGEEIRCEGMIKCDGFLNCEVLEVTARGQSKLNEVGAATVKIAGGPSIINELFGKFLPEFIRENKFVAKVIEGDNIELENCEVKVVRGKNIKIGSRCKIGLVEYSDNYEVSPDTVVEQVNRL